MAKKIKINLGSKSSIRRGMKKWEQEVKKEIEKEIKKLK
jgi:hypothetical protein